MACSFLLCEGCCGGLLLHCRVREHREHGQELYPGAPLDEVPPLRISNILCSDNVKIKITAVHAWLASPIRKLGWVEYTAYTLIPSRPDFAIHYTDLTSSVLAALRIDGLPRRYLIASQQSQYSAAFAQGRGRYQSPDGFPHLRLRITLRPGRDDGWSAWLQRHVPNLEPEEANLNHDFDTLGEVPALIVCISGDVFHRTRTSVRTLLPRRRLVLDDCKFYISDLSVQDRFDLKIAHLCNEEIVGNPREPLNATVGSAEGTDIFVISLSLP